MKAKHIKRLRLKIKAFNNYTVVESNRLFGCFEAKDKGVNIMASNTQHAVRRYMQWYRRSMKQLHNEHFTLLRETTASWGKFLVIDNKGYKTYY